MEKVLVLSISVETRENNQISSDTLAELTEIILKIIYLNLMKKTFLQKRGAAIGTKFSTHYATVFYG